MNFMLVLKEKLLNPSPLLDSEGERDILTEASVPLISIIHKMYFLQKQQRNFSQFTFDGKRSSNHALETFLLS